MTSLAAARTGLAGGLTCLLPIACWLGPQLLDPGAGPGTLARGLAGLWLAQGLAIAVVAPRVVASSWAEGAAGLLTLIAVPLPLIAAIWLAGAAGVISLLAGVSLLVLLAAGMLALGRGLERASWSERWGGIARATLQVACAGGLWWLREDWLSLLGSLSGIAK